MTSVKNEILSSTFARVFYLFGPVKEMNKKTTLKTHELQTLNGYKKPKL